MLTMFSKTMVAAGCAASAATAISDGFAGFVAPKAMLAPVPYR